MHERSIAMTPEDAVIEAIKTLVASGHRAYVHNVPETATDIYYRVNQGVIDKNAAYNAVANAIGELAKNGRIGAHVEPWKDWTMN